MTWCACRVFFVFVLFIFSFLVNFTNLTLSWKEFNIILIIVIYSNRTVLLLAFFFLFMFFVLFLFGSWGGGRGVHKHS